MKMLLIDEDEAVSGVRCPCTINSVTINMIRKDFPIEVLEKADMIVVIGKYPGREVKILKDSSGLTSYFTSIEDLMKKITSESKGVHNDRPSQ